ncbi:MAG: IS6 family transposase [Clostridium perfringens]|nr:IS6 family transposase [Clostridium perfringens]
MNKNIFKHKHFKSEIIILSIRWYLKYPLSYRNVAEMLLERGISVNPSTIMRWTHEYGPILEKKIRKYLRKSNSSWRVDETYIKVKGKWIYLYRAIDSHGDTIDFYLSKTRDTKGAKRFFTKALKVSNSSCLKVITVDKNPPYKAAIPEMKLEKKLKQKTILRQIKYLNNIIEQDHRFIKKKVRYTKSFKTAKRTLAGIEAMHMIKKGQVKNSIKSVLFEMQFINKLLSITS